MNPDAGVTMSMMPLVLPPEVPAIWAAPRRSNVAVWLETSMMGWESDEAEVMLPLRISQSTLAPLKTAPVGDEELFSATPRRWYGKCVRVTPPANVTAGTVAAAGSAIQSDISPGL